MVDATVVILSAFAGFLIIYFIYYIFFSQKGSPKKHISKEQLLEARVKHFKSKKNVHAIHDDDIVDTRTTEKEENTVDVTDTVSVLRPTDAAAVIQPTKAEFEETVINKNELKFKINNQVRPIASCSYGSMA